jgi:4-amino-4-deoxy-L-arabinose transferase-like glycosyltransferase
VSEWAARVGSAVAGLGGALAIATCAPQGWRRRGAHVMAAVVLATSLEYAFLSRSAVTDMTLTLFVTLGFLAIAAFLESGRLTVAAAAGAAFGLATLTKGPVGVIVPGLALVGYGLATRRKELLAPRALAAAVAGFAATALPWYAYMVAAHRDLVLHVFLGEENLGRFVNPEHRQFPLFYVAVLAAGLLPWSAALPAGLLRAYRALRRGEERPGESPGAVFALFWFAGVVGVFSLSASKLLTYILPAFPAAAYLIADYWCDALAATPGAGRARMRPLTVAAIGAAMSLTAAAALVVVTRTGRFSGPAPAFYGLAALLAVLALASVAAVRAFRLTAFAMAQAASTIAVVLVVVVFAWPGLEPLESTKTLVGRLAAQGLTNQLAGAYRVTDVSLDFYLDRTLPREIDAGGLARRVESEPGRLWVVRADEVDGLAAREPLLVERVMTVSRRAVVRLSPREPEGARKVGS